MAQAQITEKYTTKTGSVYTRTLVKNEKDSTKIVYESWGKGKNVFNDAVYISSKLCRDLIKTPSKSVAENITRGKDERYLGKDGCLLYVQNHKLYHSSSFLLKPDLKKPSKLEDEIILMEESPVPSPVLKNTDDGDIVLASEDTNVSLADMDIPRDELLDDLDKLG